MEGGYQSMSNQVDNRVVSMEFDNKRFEKNVETSISTLDKLKKSLKLEGATKGLEEVDRTAKKIDMSGLSNAVETINSRLSALGIMGVTALTNITNSAVNAGKQMVKALTIDPIKTGFQEYETQINSVQTILANTESKGSTLQDVNNALAELNTYADKTIYNFTEMTRNIGTFTAAGVDLKTSTAAIKGIANLAAVSGSTSQQASTAMYQLSQAMASGTVKLMDWNSVVNAGMGGQVFQDALKETARVHKINIDAMIKEEGSFRETLQKGWLTTDILTETLSKFTGDLSEKQLKQMGYTDEQIAGIVKMGKTANDAATKVKTFTQLFDTLKEAAQSGWTKTWEIIVGDFGEAKDLLTEISDIFGGVIGDSADSRNKLLSGALSTGWKQLLNEGITDAAGFEERVTEVAKKHGVDLSKMINDETTFQDTLKEGWMTSEILSESIVEYGKKLKGMSEAELEAAGYTMKDVEAFEALEKKLSEGKISVEEFTQLMSRKSGRELLIESLRNALKSLMSIINPIKDAFNNIFPATTADQLYSLIEKFTAFTSKLTLNETQSENLRRTFEGLFAVLDIGVDAVKAIGSGILDLIGYIAPAGNGILGFTAGIGDFLVKIRNAVKSTNLFGNIIKGISAVLKPIAEGIKTLGKSISDAFTDIMGKAELRFEPLTALGNALKAIFVGIGKVLAKAMPLIVGLAKGIGTIFSSLMEKISSSIQGADYNALFDILNGSIFSAIGIFIAKFIKSGGDILDNAGGILENIKEIIGGVGDALEAFTQQLKAKTLGEIAKAIAILAGALLILSLIDSSKLTESLAAITVLFTELMASMSFFEKMISTKGIGKIVVIGATLKSLATALLILAVAMKIMSTMSWKEMGVGLISITVGLGALVAAVNLLPEKKIDSAAKSIKKLSSAMVIFAIALKIMGSMSWKEMGIGLISMAAGLTMMVGAVHLLPKDTSKRAAGMMGLATSMVVLGAALKIMGSMSWKEMGIGLISMAGGLALMVAAVNLLPKDTAIKTIGMIGLATALVIMASALQIMGSMSWKEMGVALITLAGSLTVITVAMMFMQNALPGAAALLLIAGALAILAPVLQTFASMGLGEIVKSLGMLAGVFAVIGLAGYLLAPVVPAILGLAGSIALLGVGVLAAGVGVLALAAGITALGAALGIAGAGIVTFIAGIIGLIPFLIEQVGIGIIKLCEVIAGSGNAICAAVTTIIVAVVDALVTCIPTIAEGAYKLIVGLLEILIEYLPQIVPLLVDLFVKLIDLTVEHLPTITEAIFRLIAGILDSIASNISQLIEPLVKLFGAIFQGIADVIGPVVQEVIAPLLEVILDCFVKLFEVLEPHIPMICELIVYLATVITNAIVRIFEIIAPYMPEVTRIVEIIADAVTKIIDDVVRLFEQISPILDSISNVISEAGDAIKDALDGVSGVIDSVGGLIKSFFDGISGVIDSVGNAALNAGTGFEKLANGVKIITKLNLADMAASLAAVATGLGKIAKNSDGISETGTGMKKIADSVKISESAFNSMSVGITNMIEKMSSIGTTADTAMTSFTSSITNATSKLSVISSDVSSETSKITASITAMCTASVAAINSFKSRFAEAGKYLIQGLANGIRANKYVATSAAREVANAVEKIIRSAWQVNSPSKLFYKIALGVGEGIRNAFGDSVLSVKRSASDLADTANDGFSNTIRQIAEFINSDMDAQPTIRPVLDLSDVKAGANSIAGMFSGNRTLAVSAPGIGAISASMASRQNGNNDLVSAINKLAKSNSKSGDTYQINGINYSEGSDVADAIQTLVRAAKMEGRT
jgi:tape measure domain-containing protein